MTGLGLWMLVEWGFLATVVSVMCFDLLSFPLTSDLSVWYTSHGLMGAGMVTAIAWFGSFHRQFQHRFAQRIADEEVSLAKQNLTHFRSHDGLVRGVPAHYAPFPLRHQRHKKRRRLDERLIG
jgi:hypothetical protein